MDIKLGDKIRQLRKKNNVTQEKFAEYLGVTPQAVSRWESGTCYPDVGLLLTISNFFSVTLDELFEAERSMQRIESLKWNINEKRIRGYTEDAIDAGRKALKEFPNNYELMSELIMSLGNTNWTDHKDEIISLAMRILEDCNDDRMRLSTIQTLVRVYSDNDELEKAREMVERLPSIYCTEDLMMPEVTKGEEKLKYIMREIFYLTDALSSAIRDFGKYEFEKTNNITESELRDKIAVFNKANKIIETIYDAGDYGFYNHYITLDYEYIAKCYIVLGEYENALESLEKAADSCIAFEENSTEFQYTSLLVSKLTNPPGYQHDKPSNMSYDFIHDELKLKIYDPIRKSERFKKVIEKLQAYAKAEQYEREVPLIEIM